MTQEIIDKIYIVKKTLDELSILLNLNIHSDKYVQFLEMHSTLNDIIAKNKYDTTSQELFYNYISALVQQGTDITMALKNRKEIIPLLRIIELENGKQFPIRYKNANKAIISLSTSTPSFWQKILNLKG